MLLLLISVINIRVPPGRDNSNRIVRQARRRHISGLNARAILLGVYAVCCAACAAFAVRPQLLDIKDWTDALKGGLPPVKLPKYIFGTAGCYSFMEEKLRPILEYEDLKTGVFQVRLEPSLWFSFWGFELYPPLTSIVYEVPGRARRVVVSEGWRRLLVSFRSGIRCWLGTAVGYSSV